MKNLTSKIIKPCSTSIWREVSVLFNFQIHNQTHNQIYNQIYDQIKIEVRNQIFKRLSEE